jgi:hypothetical protein
VLCAVKADAHVRRDRRHAQAPTPKVPINRITGHVKLYCHLSGFGVTRDLDDYFRFAEHPREVTWPSIVSVMAICRQPLPAQLEYPRDERTLGSDRNHSSIPHRGKDTRRVLPAQARPWHELLGCSRCAVYWWRLNSCMLLLGRRDFVLLPTLHAVPLGRAGGRSHSARVQNCSYWLVMAARSTKSVNR